MAKTFRYQHLRTNNPGSEPSTELIREGEIAVNLAKDNEKLFLKNTDDEIVKFIPESQIDAKIAAQTGSTEAEINELTNSVNAISGAVGALDTKVDGVSSTTSTALESKVDSSTYNSYTSATDSALSSKANSTDVYNKSETYTKAEVDTKVLNDINDFFDDVKYEESGTTHVISFYHGNTLKGVVDAAPFLVDGMVQDAEVKTIDGVTYLVISFNTDAGRQDISVPISSIFNPDNYFTKNEVEDLVEDEEIRAKSAESVLTTNLANEITARTKAVSDEEIRAKSVETTLNGNITSHVSDTNIHVTTSDKVVWNGKQDKLVSGINIKTIQGDSILGNGNIELGIGDLKTNGVADFTIDGGTVILEAGTY